MRVVIPAAIGLALVLPFAVLEVVNRPGAGLPLPLFSVLWLLPSAVAALLRPLVRSCPADGATGLRIGFAVLLAWAWIAILVDQWPCFLGVPVCD